MPSSESHEQQTYAIALPSACRSCGKIKDPCDCKEVQEHKRKCDQCLASPERDCDRLFPCRSCIQQGLLCSYARTHEARCGRCKHHGAACDHLIPQCSRCEEKGFECGYPLDGEWRAREAQNQQQACSKNDTIGIQDDGDTHHTYNAAAQIHDHATFILKKLWEHASSECDGLEELCTRLDALEHRTASIRRLGTYSCVMPSADVIDDLIEVFHSTYGKVYPVIHEPTFRKLYDDERQSGPGMTPFRCLILAMMACAAPLGIGTHTSYEGKHPAVLISVQRWITQASLYCGSLQQHSNWETVVHRQTQFFLWIARRMPCIDWLEFAEYDDEDEEAFNEYITHPLLFTYCSLDLSSPQRLDAMSVESLRRLNVAVLQLGLQDDLKLSCHKSKTDIAEQLREFLKFDFSNPSTIGLPRGPRPKPNFYGFPASTSLLAVCDTLGLRQRCNQAVHEQSLSITDVAQLCIGIEDELIKSRALSSDMPTSKAFFELELRHYYLLLLGRLLCYGSGMNAASRWTYALHILETFEHIMKLLPTPEGDSPERFRKLGFMLHSEVILGTVLLALDFAKASSPASPIEFQQQARIFVLVDRLEADFALLAKSSCPHFGFNEIAFRMFVWIIATAPSEPLMSRAAKRARLTYHPLYIEAQANPEQAALLMLKSMRLVATTQELKLNDNVRDYKDLDKDTAPGSSQHNAIRVD